MKCHINSRNHNYLRAESNVAQVLQDVQVNKNNPSWGTAMGEWVGVEAGARSCLGVAVAAQYVEPTLRRGKGGEEARRRRPRSARCQQLSPDKRWQV